MKKILITLAFLSALLPVGQAFAEITTPYTVDEKDPVHFGDMTDVSGHNGLQNYTHEYVNGYLHLTFTYTHHTITFSSFPPKIYVTAEDPRTTATPTVRQNIVIFQLLATTHPTDWYLYDIQFDAAGYTQKVLEAGTVETDNEHVNVAGLLDTDWAALANDYDIDPSTDFSMSFTPLLVHEAPASSSASAEVAPTHREGERGRCVETSTGVYCPDEEVRQAEIMRLMELLIEKLRELIVMLANALKAQTSISL